MAAEITTTTAATTAPACPLFLAPSTLPGAGLGLFTGISHNVGSTVTAGDISLPLIHFEWHTGQHDPDFDPNNDIHFLWDEYTWNKDAFVGMSEESPSEDVHGISFGVGAIPNCYFAGVNIQESYTRLSQSLHRSTDPGAGASSPYWDRRGIAIEVLEAGQELFVDYGYDYFGGDRERSIGLVPFWENYEQANELVEALLDLEDEVAHNVPEDIFSDLYEWIKRNVSSIWPSRSWWALPNASWLDVSDYVADGFHLGHWERTSRDVHWLSAHGECLGYLHVNESSIPQAGRGAFATKSFAQNEVVTAVPLLHIPDRTVLNMYKRLRRPFPPVPEPNAVTERELHTLWHRNTTTPEHFQLLLNYCFGHADSTLLLCPYGVVSSVVNHGPNTSRSTRLPSGQPKANVRLEWNTKLSSNLSNWRDLPPKDWATTHRAGLVLNFVADRNIAVGEEILLDYGEEWEKAWIQHVETWAPPKDAVTYTPSWYYNEIEVDSILPTYQEDRSFYHRKEVAVHCHDSYRLLNKLEPASIDLHPCRVTQRFPRKPGGYAYVAEVINRQSFPNTRICLEVVVEILFDLPRDAFYFLDEPFTRDHAQAWSFRHDLRLPDHIFFPAWKNLNRDGS